MDDALAQVRTCFSNMLRRVLILVVMDDALALVKFFNKDYNYQSLNPCCNG